jgi:alpha-mannosidase
VERVDCRTVVDGFTGADRLLRLRWPCPVPGAMPVSEVGTAVIGRGFALLHEPGTAQSVDTAVHPHTLDNPAHGWFGLSSAARIRFAGSSVRAISVAEVVMPPDADAAVAGAVRTLMVALARAGVTATCSTAAAPRYGDLSVDSNLPDVRISLGDNAFTASVLDGPATARRMWVPAAAELRDVWVPGADLRDARALPVLVVGASGDVVAEILALADDLADHEIVVDQPVDAPFESYTVAVVNRGMPGFAVDTDGTLHLSLMRSCTGWPSGTWIDPPRRNVPDGSGFGLQHWTHTFDYAVAAGPGDWRDIEMPRHSAEFNNALTAVPARHETGGGGLPTWGSLLEVDPPGSVAVTAVKMAGNPTARGSTEKAGPSIAVRLAETLGREAVVTLQAGLRKVPESSAQRLDLIERPVNAETDGITLGGFDITTVQADVNMPRVLDAEGERLGPDAEAAQPLYSRYWLHNRGPAPLGGLPIVAHLHPHRLTAGDDRSTLRLTVASDAADTALHGRVRVLAPPGWTVDVAELPFVLPPGEYLDSAIHLDPPAGLAPGLYPVRAEVAVTGAAIPAAWQQTVEDVCLVSVGQHDHHVLRLHAEPTPVQVAAGRRATLSATVATDAHDDLAVEAHVISPWDTWAWLTPGVLGEVVPARGTVELRFDIAPPPWTSPGSWWALIRVACAGELLYTPAVAIEVTG